MSAKGANLDLIFDTHALVWYGAGSTKFSPRVRHEVQMPECRIFVSAVTAWQYSDLLTRGRLAGASALDILQFGLDFEILDVPAKIWCRASALPNLHRDPVDRMLIAHALEAGLTIATADRTIHRYPVRTFW